MKINIQNVEELIFQNKEIWKKMPEMSHLRDQWRMSKMSPVLRALGRKSLLDFLRSAKGAHEDILSEYFKTTVTIDKIERSIVKNIELDVQEEDPSFEFEDIYTSFSTYRNKDKIYITFWR
jgi:hypothetical protein